MHLMSCENPKRIFNKYIGEFVWTSCGECNTCRNARAARFASACERERSNSLFTMFVTLTYDNYSLPVYNFTGGFETVEYVPENERGFLRSSRLHDVECISFDDLQFDTDADKELFWYYLKENGIPYASKTDIQLFLKRLNKYFHDHVTNQYKNFRYFIVSELGSTTLRPHFHAVFFVNDSAVAKSFQQGILSCWKYGRCDVQYVEKSACSYVSQYINKPAYLPTFYKAKQIRPFYLCSRNPFIGTCNQYAESDEKILDECTPKVSRFSKKDFLYVPVSLDYSTENRLFPKCSYYRTLSHSLRIELYTVICRFPAKGFAEFREKVESFMDSVYSVFDYKKCSEFSEFLRVQLEDFNEKGVNWLRRVYYLSRKFLSTAKRFGLSIYAYLQKIETYWNNKELYLLSEFYSFQSEYLYKNKNKEDLSVISLMYPEYLYKNGFTFKEIIDDYRPVDVLTMIKDSASRAITNKLTHFKNIYFESVKITNNRFYSQLKKFYYAKKCNEIIEALAS